MVEKSLTREELGCGRHPFMGVQALVEVAGVHPWKEQYEGLGAGDSFVKKQ